MIAAAKAGRPDTFLTLTITSNWGISPSHRAKQLSHAWRRIRRLALKEATRDVRKRAEPYGADPEKPYARDPRGWVPRKIRLRNGELPFIAVFEDHKSGEPHLHMLLRCEWFDRQWLVAQMMAECGSYIQDVKRIHSKKQTAYYCTKYVGKNPHRYDGVKRYWSSQNYCDEADVQDEKDQPKLSWQWSKHPAQFLIEELEENHWVGQWEGSTWRAVPQEVYYASLRKEVQ